MADYRVQVVGQVVSTDPGADYVTNVLSYSAATTLPPAIGDAVHAAYRTLSVARYGNFAQLWTKVYDRAAPPMSPPVYTKHDTGPGVTGLGPRQCALCLSFYSGLNIKGQRGRIYIGPWATVDLAEFATTAQMNAVLAMGNALKNPGGADVVLGIWHKHTASHSNVSNFFVNNRWDTMRSRLGKETARVHSP